MWNNTISKQRILRCAAAVLFIFCLISLGVRQTRAQTQVAQVPQSTKASILLTAVDNDGRFVSTPRADDLQVLVDGAPQKIDGFQRITDRSLSLVILIDTSASQERTLQGQKLAANAFLDAVVRPGIDRVAVATFTGTSTVEQPLTNDLPALRQAISRAVFVPPPGYVRGGIVIGPLPPLKRTPAALAGQTAVWDAVINICNDVFRQPGGEARRAIIVLTDGQDTISKSKMADAVDRALRDDVAIYRIGIGDDSMDGVDKGALRKLSERTGGRAFFPKKIGDLNNIFADIGQELRSQYLITHNPTSNFGSSGKIKIEILNPDLRKAEVQLFYQQSVPRK